MKIPVITTAAAAVLSTILLSGCVKIEWRGGMTPSLNWNIEGDGNALTSSNTPAKDFRLKGIPTTTDWPDFRGPGRRGIAPEQGIDLDWKPEPATLWRKPIGRGHASIIVIGNRYYTLEQQGEFEVLICASMLDGSPIWNFRRKERWNDSMGGLGPRSTPVYSKGKIFYLSSRGILTCIKADSGKVSWEQATLDPEYDFPHWGIACSPLISGNMIIVSPGGESGAVKSYDVENGKLMWTAELKGGGTYLSPSILNLIGEKFLVVAVEGKLCGLDPTTGMTLWEHPWKIFMNNAQITQPLELSEEVFLLSAGYGKGAEAIRLKKNPNGYAKEQVWKSKDLKTKFSSPILKDGFLYGFSESTLNCLDASTGELKWRGKKYGYGRILLAKDKLLILGNTGILSIVAANPYAFEEIASHQVLSKERCWNGPALVGGYLVVRNGSGIACYDFAKL
jgi:outer membrane protein assembly factor BamB